MFRPAIAIIKRELISTLRNPYYFRAVAGLLFVLLVLLIGYFYQNPTLHLDDAMTMRTLSMGIFAVYSYALYGIAVLLLPIVASNSVCSEKQQEQLDLVRMTYIRPPAFLFAKAVNILGLFFFFAIATFPVASLLFYFTGVDWMQYGQIFLLLSLVAVSSTAIGLLCSCYFYRTIPAAVTTGVLVFLSQGVIEEVVSLTLEGFGGSQYTHDTGVALLPGWGIIAIAEGSIRSVWVFVVAAVTYFGSITLCCAFLAHRVLERPTKPMKVNQEKTIEDPALLEARRKQFPYYLIDPRRRRPLIGDHQDPVLAKERYSSLANRGTTSIRILYSVAILSVILGAFGTALVGTERDAERTIRLFVFVETVLLLALAPTFMATTFSKEHEWGNWDSLRMTLLTPRDVVWGKFLGALQALALPTLALLIGTLPFIECIIRFPSAFGTLVSSLIFCFTNLVYLCALAILTATRFERSLPALMATYAMSFLMLLIFPTLLMAFYSIATNDIPDVAWLFLSPALTMANEALDDYVHFGAGVAPISAIVFTALSLFLLKIAQRRYARDWYAREPRHTSAPEHHSVGELVE